jgi:hypothetical protein
MRLLVALLLGLALAACAGKPSVDLAQTYLPKRGTIIPDTVLKVSPRVSIPLEKLVYWGALVGIVYWVTDPLAPNWEIEEAPLGDEYIHFSLQMKRYYIGGAGEARALFHRRAKELMRLNEFDTYTVVEYTESLDSSVLGSQRKAEGVVQLGRKLKPLPPA